MASNRPDIQRLCVVGGNLDHTDSQILRENGGQPLVIGYLNKSGKVFIWNEKSPSLKRARWIISRQLYVKDFVLSNNGLAIVTDLGEVFVCTPSNKPTPVRESISTAKESVDGEFGRMSLMELLLQEEIEDVQVRKVVNIHRAMYITADRKGNNYATLQSLPNSSLTDVPVISVPEMTACFSKLLDEVDEYDLIHDLILQVHGQRWPVHKYILVNRCANFPSLLVSKSQALNEMDIPIVEVNDLHPQILEQLLLYVYTDTCDLLTSGTKFVLSEDPARDVHEDIFHIDLNELHEDSSVTTGNKKRSAFQVVQQGKCKKKQETDRTRQNIERNPLKLLLEVGKKWGVKGLEKRLGCVTYIKGQICLAMKTMPKTLLRFDRNKLRDTKWELYDVSLQSEDGVVFQCHKCVLVARLEYFHSMLATGWMETSSSTALSLPVPGDILEILLEYLYTDESRVVNTTQNVELLCNILVVADQMLVARLREMCETAIAVLVTLKNVGELLEFSIMYNADQLKWTCQQYIVLNLSALLEGRYLDVLSDGVIHELSKYYKNSIPNMSSRIITPYDEGPEKSYLEFLVSQTIEDSENSPAGATPFEPRKSKSKRKRNRTKSSTEEQERGQDRGQRRISERHLSASSDVGIRSDDDCGGVYRVHELSIDCVVEHQSQTSPTSPASPLVGSESQISPSLKSPVSPRQNVGHWSQPGPVQAVNISSHKAYTSGPSLRDIMQEELTRTGKSNHSGQKSGKVSWKEIKKQQQVQQKIASQRINNNTNSRGVGSSTAVPAGDMQQTAKSRGDEKTMTACPWASLDKVVSSFRNLMVEDQQATAVRSQLVKGAPRTNPKVQQVTAVRSQLSKGPLTTIRKINVSRTEQGRRQAHHNNVVSWGLPHNNKSSKDARAVSPSNTTPTESAPPKNAWGVDPASPRSPESSWVASAMASTPPDSVFRFSDIVKDEQQKRDVLTRTTNKPLALIQIEEQAIQDLLKLYKAGDNVDEHITVERVTQESAAPVWKRERVQSS